MKYCLYCVYNGHEMQQYLKQLLRLQRSLKAYGDDKFTANTLFSFFEATIIEFMQGIKDKLVEQMLQAGLVMQRPPERRYSMDDYFLIDRVFSKSYHQHGFQNELFFHCSRYLNDPARYD